MRMTFFAGVPFLVVVVIVVIGNPSLTDIVTAG
jgi:hypothetical protein